MPDFPVHVAPLRASAVAGLLLLSVAASVSAQDGLIVNGRAYSATRAFGEDLGVAPGDLLGPLAGGGRYAVRAGSVLDRRTGVSIVVPDGSEVVGVDPVRPRVFIRFYGALFAVLSEFNPATGVTRALTILGARQVMSSAALRYAHAVDRLFIDVAEFPSNPSTVFEHDVRVIDPTSGSVVPGGFTFAGARDSPWMVTPEGDVAFAATPGGLVAVDLATGRRRAVSQPVTGFYWDELNEHLFASVGASLVVLTRDAAVLGSAAMGECYFTRVSPHTGRLYVGRHVRGTADAFSDLRVFDARTFELLGRQMLPDSGDCSGTVVTAPGPPRSFRSAVSGRDVMLTWTNVGAASHFVLDVGSAPGRADLSLLLGPDSHVSFANVPPGTYYLRLRGGNEFGGGRASNEIQLVVP